MSTVPLSGRFKIRNCDFVALELKRHLVTMEDGYN